MLTIDVGPTGNSVMAGLGGLAGPGGAASVVGIGADGGEGGRGGDGGGAGRGGTDGPNGMLGTDGSAGGTGSSGQAGGNGQPGTTGMSSDPDIFPGGGGGAALRPPSSLPFGAIAAGNATTSLTAVARGLAPCSAGSISILPTSAVSDRTADTGGDVSVHRANEFRSKPGDAESLRCRDRFFAVERLLYPLLSELGGA
jgi:hypothetical protein